MKRGVHSEHSLRGEIEFALQHGEPPSGEWTLRSLAEFCESSVGAVKEVVLELREEGYVVTPRARGERGSQVVRWN